MGSISQSQPIHGWLRGAQMAKFDLAYDLYPADVRSPRLLPIGSLPLAL